MRVAESRILVTGASSGIGAAMAHHLAAKGARLVLTARNEVRLRRTAMDIVRAHPEAACPLVVPGDLSSSSDRGRIVEQARSRWGGLDALVNNAGISAYGQSDQVPLTDYRRLMELNFFAPVRLTLEILPEFRFQGHGTVVNVASLAAIFGVPFLGAYGPSKAALVNFSQSLRAELHDTGIHVLVVYPGYTDTDLFAREARSGNAHRPAGRYPPADGVAAAVVRAMERDREELVLTLAGKAMQRARGVAPWLLDRVMAVMASRLEHPAAPETRRTVS